jgi:hypothetical protein
MGPELIIDAIFGGEYQARMLMSFPLALLKQRQRD